MAFATGLGLGLLALPLAVLCGSILGGGYVGVLAAFVALVAGAATLPPVSGKRIAGVATGVAIDLGVVAAFAYVVSVLFTAPWG